MMVRWNLIMIDIFTHQLILYYKINMGGDEIIERVKEVIKFIKSGDDDKAVLYLNYIMEDIEMYKRSSL